MSEKQDQVNEALLEQPAESESRTLDRTQINYAIELIEERHKLRNTPWRVTWPFIKWLCFCCLKPRKKSFNLALKRAIRRKLVLSVPKSD